MDKKEGSAKNCSGTRGGEESHQSGNEEGKSFVRTLFPCLERDLDSGNNF